MRARSRAAGYSRCLASQWRGRYWVPTITSNRKVGNRGDTCPLPTIVVKPLHIWSTITSYNVPPRNYAIRNRRVNRITRSDLYTHSCHFKCWWRGRYYLCMGPLRQITIKPSYNNSAAKTRKSSSTGQRRRWYRFRAAIPLTIIYDWTSWVTWACKASTSHYPSNISHSSNRKKKRRSWKLTASATRHKIMPTGSKHFNWETLFVHHCTLALSEGKARRGEARQAHLQETSSLAPVPLTLSHVNYVPPFFSSGKNLYIRWKGLGTQWRQELPSMCSRSRRCQCKKRVRFELIKKL